MIEMNKSRFDEIKVNLRVKLSALWTSLMFCYIYGDYFELYTPNKVKSLITGVNILDSPAKLLAASVFLVIPALMIFLSVIVNAKVSRSLNIIFGFFFTALMILVALTSLERWLSFYVFFACVEIIISSTIIYQAWNWPSNASGTQL